MASQLLVRLDPEITVRRRLEARLTLAAGLGRQRGTDPLREVLAAPTFPKPAWQYVRDYAPDLLLPGVQVFPPDSVTLAETNPAFAEAFLTGLNHEMARGSSGVSTRPTSEARASAGSGLPATRTTWHRCTPGPREP